MIARWQALSGSLRQGKSWTQTGTLLPDGPDQQVVKFLSALKSPNKLCGVSILFRSVWNQLTPKLTWSAELLSTLIHQTGSLWPGNLLVILKVAFISPFVAIDQFDPTWAYLGVIIELLFQALCSSIFNLSLHRISAFLLMVKSYLVCLSKSYLALLSLLNARPYSVLQQKVHINCCTYCNIPITERKQWEDTGFDSSLRDQFPCLCSLHSFCSI